LEIARQLFFDEALRAASDQHIHPEAAWVEAAFWPQLVQAVER